MEGKSDIRGALQESSTFDQNEKESPEMKRALLAVQKQTEILTQRVLKVDLSTHKPPFVPFTFSEWRRESMEQLEPYFKKLNFIDRQNALRVFINGIDMNLLFSFSKKMKQPYFELVFYDNYAIPKGLDFQAARKDYLLFKDLEGLAHQIAEWCIQIELAADLVDRAELYQYFECEQEEKQIYKDLKEKLQSNTTSTTFGDKIRGFFKKSVTYSMKTLSNFVWTKGLALSNISMGALILLYYSFLGTTSLPFQILMPQLRISWLVGGIVGSLALNQVAESIDRGEASNNLHRIAEIFKEITLNLLDFNESCSNLVRDCNLAKSEEQLSSKSKELRFNIRKLLDNAEQLTEIKARVSKLRNVIERQDESDDDIVLLELEDVQEKK